MKIKTTMILTMMLAMLVMATGLCAAAKKPAVEPVTTGAEPLNAGTISSAPDSFVGSESYTTARDVGSESYTTSDVVGSESYTTDGEDDVGGSAHISEQVDSAVQFYLIPILVLLLGFIKVTWDKERFRKILIIAWGLAKECDNLFADPAPELKSQISLHGLNPAKKNWVEDKLNRSLSSGQIALAEKKAGSLRNVIELALTAFKYGGPIIGGLLKQIKKW